MKRLHSIFYIFLNLCNIVDFTENQRKLVNITSFTTDFFLINIVWNQTLHVTTTSRPLGIKNANNLKCKRFYCKIFPDRITIFFPQSFSQAGPDDTNPFSTLEIRSGKGTSFTDSVVINVNIIGINRS